MTVFGLSTHPNPIVSQTISVVEAYERLFMRYKGIKNSNGCAVQSSQELAEKAASFELMERDSYLRFHYSGECESEIDYVDLLKNQNLVRELKKENIQIVIRLMSSNKLGYATIAMANGLKFSKPFGLTIGLGFKDDLAQSAESAFSEVTRMLNSQFSKVQSLDSMSFNEFNSHENPSVHEHIKLGFDIEYADFLIEKYYGARSPVNFPKEPELIYETEEAKLPGIEPPGLFFSRATSKDLIQISFGKSQKYIETHFPPELILKFKQKTAHHILG